MTFFFFFYGKYPIFICIVKAARQLCQRKEKQRSKIKKCVCESGNIEEIPYIFRVDVILTQALLNIFSFSFTEKSRILHRINLTTCDLIRLSI